MPAPQSAIIPLFIKQSDQAQWMAWLYQKINMSEEQLRQLQRQLWNIADTLRGKMNADEFRDYILGFIF